MGECTVCIQSVQYHTDCSLGTANTGKTACLNCRAPVARRIKKVTEGVTATGIAPILTATASGCRSNANLEICVCWNSTFILNHSKNIDLRCMTYQSHIEQLKITQIKHWFTFCIVFELYLLIAIMTKLLSSLI